MRLFKTIKKEGQHLEIHIFLFNNIVADFCAPDSTFYSTIHINLFQINVQIYCVGIFFCSQKKIYKLRTACKNIQTGSRQSKTSILFEQILIGGMYCTL